MGRDSDERQFDDAETVASVRENFRFLILEVVKQLEDTREAMEDPRPGVLKKISGRDDYIDNLKSIIENKCYGLITDHELAQPTIDLIRAINICTNNLERVADFAVNIVGQLRYLEDQETVDRFGPEPFFSIVLKMLGQVEEALFTRDMNLALGICKSEWEADELYSAVFRQIMDELRAGHGPEDLVTALFIYRYFERMGDALLNVGEAVIFAAVGEKLKVGQYQALQKTLASSDVDVDISDLDYEGIWASKSGAQIGTLHEHGDPDARWVVFKEGQAKKVEEEKDALERWHELVPGMPPKVFGFHEHGDKASLLMEYVQGDTLQHIVLDADSGVIEDALLLLLTTMAGVWRETKIDKSCRAKYMKQLKRRLGDVYKVHPEFQVPHHRIGELEARSFEELIDRAEKIDDQLKAPFRVLIHGDFNTDNVIINVDRKEIHFIDLHRSKPADFVQDVSTFLLSNFRIPVFEPALRGRLDSVNREFLHFARDFAAKEGDEGFDARLALGLARSFTTSTRFQLDEEFSQAMFMRAVYLLERLIEHEGRPWSEFRINDEVLVY